MEKVKAEMKRRFHKDVQIDPLEANHILAYAYLEANAEFTVPFFDNRGTLHFRDSSGKETPLSSFGIEEKHEYAYKALREQIEVLYVLRNNTTFERPDEFALDLCRDSWPNQILVALVPPKPTLLALLKDVEDKMQNSAIDTRADLHQRFGIRDVRQCRT